MFYIIIFIILLFFSFLLLYLVNRFQKFSFIKRIDNKYIRFFLSILPLVILFLIFNYIDSVVILFHLVIFISLSELIMFIIKKFYKKEFRVYYPGIIGIILTVIYLGFGAYSLYHVKYTYYYIESTKNIGKDNFRIIQISDSHIGATFKGEGFSEYINRLNDVESDIVVITGDFVDDDTKKIDMIQSVKALSQLKPKYGIFYINGNHDKGYSNYRDFSYDNLKNELLNNGINVLEDETVLINDNIYLIGRKDKSDNTRKTIDELVENLDKNKYIIDLNHQPNDYKNEMNKVDLVLSGHTHGGQLFPLGPIGLLFGANDEYYGLHKRENTNFIVNSGISNWAMSFKTGVSSEIVIVNIENKA